MAKGSYKSIYINNKIMNNKIKLLYLGFHLNAIMLIIFNFSSEELVSLDV